VRIVELALCHPSSTYSFEVALRCLEILYTAGLDTFYMF